jgi:flagellar biosynthesis/type III secretory pathway protein FliH
MSRPYGYDEGYWDGYEAGQTEQQHKQQQLREALALEKEALKRVSDYNGRIEYQIAEQAAEIENLKTLAQALLDAQTDRWAAQDEHHCFAANVLVEATHDALAKALEVAR